MNITEILVPKDSEEVEMQLSLMDEATQLQQKMIWRLNTDEFHWADPYLLSKVFKLLYELNKHNLKYEIKVDRNLTPVDRIKVLLFNSNKTSCDIFINIRKGIL